MPLLKKVTPGTTITSTYYGGSATHSSNDVSTSHLYGSTGGPSFSEDCTKIISDSKPLLFSPGMTAALPGILTNIIGATTPADLWIDEATVDASGNAWFMLDPTKIGAAVISGIKTISVSGNDYVNYCS